MSKKKDLQARGKYTLEFKLVAVRLVKSIDLEMLAKTHRDFIK